MNAFHFIGRSKIIAAIAAACMCAETYVLFGSEIRLLIVAQVFFLTWCAYLFVRSPHIKGLRIMIIAAASGAVITLMINGWVYALALLPAIASVVFFNGLRLSELGIHPKYAIGGSETGRVLIVAACWSLATGLPPALTMNRHDLLTALIWMCGNFFFVAALCIGCFRQQNETGHQGFSQSLTGYRKPIAIFMLGMACAAFWFLSNTTSPSMGFYMAIAGIALCIVLFHPGKKPQLQSLVFHGFIISRFLILVLFQ